MMMMMGISLDRTNAAQFVAGKVAFGYQVYSLGLMSTPELDIDDELIDYLMDLYQEMGNALALQYGGSHLAHTMGTYKGLLFIFDDYNIL